MINHSVYLKAFIISMLMVTVALMTNAVNLMMFSIIFYHLMFFICIYSGIKDILLVMTRKEEPPFEDSL